MLSVWPLPGGGTVWQESLDAMLAFVAENAPTMREATDWMLARFDRVNSEKVVRSYWQVPRSFGLLETVGERLQLTADGATYTGSGDPDVLVAMMRKSVAGFEELIDELKSRPLSTGEALIFINEAIGVGWESDAQIKFRLTWLENLGVVIQRDGRWALVDRSGAT